MTVPDAGRPLPAGLTLRPWAEGDDLRLLEVWGDPADPQQHQDRAMLRPSSTEAGPGSEPWARCLVAEDEGVPVAAAVVYASSVHPQRLWFYAETARAQRGRGIATALLEALRAEVADAAQRTGTVELKTRFAVAPEPGTTPAEPPTDPAGAAGSEPVADPAAEPAPAARATEAFLAGQGFAPLQRSRRIAVGPGVITPPDLDGTGITVEDLATGSVELTQAVAAFYEATHGWDPAAMTVGRAQQLLLGPATGASGAVVLRPRPKADGGPVHAFAISYTPERTDDPTDVLLGWNPELDGADAQFAVGTLLALLTTQYPVQLEVDDAMDALVPILDQLVATGHARVLLDTRVWATDAGR